MMRDSGPFQMPATRDPPVDYVTLADFLTTLGSPVRLELLRRLRFPHTLGEIRIQPHRMQSGASPDRALARQTVQGHLDKLVETGLVHRREAERNGRIVPEYIVNPSRLYALMEELRSLSTMYAGRGLAGDATGTVGEPVTSEDATGPRLVLVHGVYEGKPFPLDRAHCVDGAWTIGRRQGLQVCLDYDPFVSLENAIVRRKRPGFTVTDLGGKNGTWVNWRRLPSGGSHTLKPGDVIGVGRSLLAFVPD